MSESLWGDVLWLWGDDWFQHGLFLAGVVILVGALARGWIEADNAIRINRKLRSEKKSPN
jgi:hypothetical protein